MANKPTCYFCQQEVKGEPDDFLCSGCNIYVCDDEVFGCGSRVSPFGRSKHRPEEHVLPCGKCGEGTCGHECGVCGTDDCADSAHRAEDMGFEECPMPPRVPTVAEVEKAIGIKAKDWNGRCFEIATKLHASGLVQGEVRYGLYWGPISDKSEKFGGRSITHHGWIERPDRTIVDPTRWAFEATAPRIWSGWGAGHYDVGGSALYDNDPLPPVRDKDAAVALKLDADTKDFTLRLLKSPPRVTKDMAIWLCHRSPDSLGRYAKPIYRALVDGGFGAYIQFDMRIAVLGKGK